MVPLGEEGSSGKAKGACGRQNCGCCDLVVLTPAPTWGIHPVLCVSGCAHDLQQVRCVSDLLPSSRLPQTEPLKTVLHSSSLATSRVGLPGAFHGCRGDIAGRLI